MVMIQKSSVIALLSLIALALAAGCGAKEGAAPSAGTAPEAKAAPSAASAAAEADEIFANRCVTCHGATGHGDGPGSASLEPKPRNFADPAWQSAVTDEHIEKIIVYGGAAVGRSPSMPSNPDLNDKPDVVKALRQHVRDLEK